MPLILPPGASSGTGVTRAAYRYRLADELGFGQRTTVSAVATNADAARVVIADELRDDEQGYQLFGAPWVYAATGLQAGNQRRMITQPDAGYQGPLGALMLSRPFAAPLAEGTVIEVTSPLPVARIGTIKGLNEIIDEALARIWIEARISLTGGGYEYSLDAYPWLTRYEQTAGIYDTLLVDPTAPPVLSSYGYRIVADGASRTLVTSYPYTSADAVQLAVRVKADRLVYDGSSWAYVETAGLGSDLARGAAPEEWVLAFGMVKALQFLTRLTEMDRSLDDGMKKARLADILTRRRDWALAAASIKKREFPQPIPEPGEPMVWMPSPQRWQ